MGQSDTGGGDLERRLRNILTTKGYEALEPDFPRPNGRSHTTIFSTAPCVSVWPVLLLTHMLHQELSFELFLLPTGDEGFFCQGGQVCSKLSDYPPYFHGQQKEYDD